MEIRKIVEERMSYVKATFQERRMVLEKVCNTAQGKVARLRASWKEMLLHGIDNVFLRVMETLEKTVDRIAAAAQQAGRMKALPEDEPLIEADDWVQ